MRPESLGSLCRDPHDARANPRADTRAVFTTRKEMTNDQDSSPPTDRVAARCVLLAIAIVAIVAAIAPNASRAKDGKLTQSFSMENLNTFDLQLTTACGTEVDALISFTQEGTLVLGADRPTRGPRRVTVDGTITWYAPRPGRRTPTSCTAARASLPQGVRGLAGAYNCHRHWTQRGTFPYEGYGFPGHEKFEYDAQIYSVDNGGFPYIFAVNEPDWTGKGFGAQPRTSARRSPETRPRRIPGGPERGPAGASRGRLRSGEQVTSLGLSLLGVSVSVGGTRSETPNLSC